MTENILVIKLSAFGDFIQALGPMAAIRRHHPDACITLLTTAPFITLGRESGYFNQIWTDHKPKWSNLSGWVNLSRRLRGGQFSRVYDLQNNDRTSLYFRLFGLKKPQWVGVARGASHRNASPERTNGHAFDGHVQTLGLVGINDVVMDDLSWVRGDSAHFGLPHPYVLLVPGSAPDRPEKRWPAASFGDLARHIYGGGFTPVIIGTLSEDHLGETIRAACRESINLCGQTSLMDIVALARTAAGAIGNDTGPMHMIAPTGCPTIVLFSKSSNPERHAPMGPNVRVLQQSDDVLGEITVRDFRHKGSDVLTG